MTISIKPTASGSTIEQDGSTILTVDGSGNITPTNGLYPKGPAFSAYMSSNQIISLSTSTKAQINTEIFDTDSCYDNATNYRFTPTVAGYYQVTLKMRASVTSPTNMYTYLYKNGSIYDTTYRDQSTVVGDHHKTSSALVYCNGTTDYLEMYINLQGSGTATIVGNANNYFASGFSAVLVSV